MKINKSSIIITIIVVALIFLTTGLYIGKFCLSKTFIETYPEEKEEEIDEETTIDTEEVTNTVDYTILIKELREKYEFAYEYISGINTYCGTTEISDKTTDGPTGTGYNKSSQFKTYAEMYEYLQMYMSDNVINSKYQIQNKDIWYLEENNSLYCGTTNKGNIYQDGDKLLDISSIKEDKIVAKGGAVSYYVTDNNTKNYQYVSYNVVFEKINESWIVTKIELIK